MKTRYAVALIGLGLLASGCGREAALETDAQIASYAVGLDIGRSLAPAAGHLDIEAFSRGVNDMMAKRDPALPDSVMQAALQRFSETIQTAMQAEADSAARERDAAGPKNLEDGQKFMAENASKSGVQTTPSGIQYEVLQAGTGPKPGPTDQVTVHYKGTLIDGTEFDTSIGGPPAQFSLAPGGLIEGFREVVQLMPVGSKYRAVIPSNLAYGPQGSGSIGPNQTLIFEVELISIP